MKKILFLSAILSLILPLEAASIQNGMKPYGTKGTLRFVMQTADPEIKAELPMVSLYRCCICKVLKIN